MYCWVPHEAQSNDSKKEIAEMLGPDCLGWNLSTITYSCESWDCTLNHLVPQWTVEDLSYKSKTA